MAVKLSRSLPIAFYPSYSRWGLSLYLWQYSTDVHMLLEQSGLLLELVSLPQSQPVKILHGHAKHLGELLWGEVTLRTQGQRDDTQLSHFLRCQ